MNLELTIQNMFNNYPTLFKERSDCLDHLFCAIGNGYHWHNGELCSNDDDYPIDESYLESCLVDGKAYQHNKLSLRAEAIHYINERKKESPIHAPELQAIFDEADEKYIARLPDNVYHRRERKYRWYFYLGGYCTKYAALFNYPEDIKPDWLAGIEECKSLLREDGYDVDNPDENAIDTKANWEESIRFSKERIYKESKNQWTLPH